MRTTVRRHLGKVVAGAAIAVTGTAVMVAITLPGTAGADDTAGRAGGAAASAAAGQQGGAGGAVPPAVVEAAPAEGDRGTGHDPLTDDEIRRAERSALSRQMMTAGEDVGVTAARSASASTSPSPTRPRRTTRTRRAVRTSRTTTTATTRSSPGR